MNWNSVIYKRLLQFSFCGISYFLLSFCSYHFRSLLPLTLAGLQTSEWQAICSTVCGFVVTWGRAYLCEHLIFAEHDRCRALLEPTSGKFHWFSMLGAHCRHGIQKKWARVDYQGDDWGFTINVFIVCMII